MAPAAVQTPADAPTVNVLSAKLDAARKVAALAVLQHAPNVPMAVCVKGKPLTNVTAAPEQHALHPQSLKCCPFGLLSPSCMFSQCRS